MPSPTCRLSRHAASWPPITPGSTRMDSETHRSAMRARSAVPSANAGHRGWKRHPAGSAGRVGRLPRQDLLLQTAGLRHHVEQRLRVRMRRGRGARPRWGRSRRCAPGTSPPPGRRCSRPGRGRGSRRAWSGPVRRAARAAAPGSRRAPTRRGRHRLVGHDELGLEHQRAGDHHALALATGELVRVAEEEPLGRSQPGADSACRATLASLLARRGPSWMRRPSATTRRSSGAG